jgi:poly-gamma-glutamate capsule biosynthesis protein CapA/YwtB (metallophosphatase superfamily)
MPPDRAAGMLADVREPLRKADIAAVNLEGTLGTGGVPKCPPRRSPTCFPFQAPASHAAALRRAGIDIVNLANNHAWDYGAQGMGQTVLALRRWDLRLTGRPGEITYMKLTGARVAFIGFSAYPWTASIHDLPGAQALIREAGRRANVVVAFIHAGGEGVAQTHTPDADEQAFGEARGNPRAFAHAAVDAGADVVLGSGPHVLRGIELYRGRLIAYSLGNLAGWHNFSLTGTAKLSGLLRVRLGRRGAFRSGRLTSLELTGPGVPQRDTGYAAARLVADVSRADFGAGAVRVARAGELRAPR